MKINFDGIATADLTTTNSYKATKSANAKVRSNTNESINKYNENMTYEGRMKSIEEFKNVIGTMDVTVTQNAMTVASNSMSQEDFNEMMRNGENPLSMEVKDTVTILDKIKLYVAMGGESIEGFTDSLDADTIEKMTGRRSIDDSISVPEYDVEIDEDMYEAIAEEYKKLSDITSMNDGMKLFFMTNDKELTIDNLYLAKHSAMEETQKQGSSYFNIEAKGYLARKATNETDDSIRTEIANLLDKLGIEVNEQNIDNGAWLVKNSVMVSKENIERITLLNNVELPISDEQFSKIILSALSKGDSINEVDVTKSENIYKEALEITSRMENLLTKEAVTKTRILEETRLMMTSEANLMLLKSGVKIDTTNLEKYVEELKKIEKSDEYKEAIALTEVSDAIKEIKEAPAHVIASLAPHIDIATIAEIRDLGNVAKLKFSDVEARYEQVGTEVRRDLGDSIKKAFRNVDDILDELGLEPTEENRRAVRILGYNTMAISKESVEEIKEADRKIQSVINRLTPEDTLSIIRKGSSPIEMSIKELNEYLDSKEDENKEEIEKYSKFLFKLEKNGEISELERKEYIDVYRFLYQLEKTDLAAIGSVISTGRELTIANLKDAMKTAKHKGMDVKVDKSFGFMVSDIRNEIAPEKLSTIEFTDEMALNELYNRLKEEASDRSMEEAWAKEKFFEMKEALKVPEEVVNELIMNKISVTAENLEAMYGLMKQRGAAFRKVLETESEEIDEKVENLIDGFVSEGEAKEKYSDLIDISKEKILNDSLNQDHYIDVKALKLVNLELSTANNLAESETYEVPMNIGGELTSINVKVVHNLMEEPNVVITLETENLGRVGARLTANSDVIEGYIATNRKEAITKIQKVADKLSDKVTVVNSTKPESDIKISKIPMKDNDKLVSTESLYEVAKQFLKALKGIDNAN